MQTYDASKFESYVSFNPEWDIDHQGWIIHPCGQNRDSDSLTRSNYKVALAALQAIDPDEQDHTVREANHWAVGWVGSILVRPGTKCAELAAEHESDLEDYCVLDEMHWGELETNEATEAFDAWAWKDFARALGHRDNLDKDAAWWLLYHAENMCPDGSWKADDDVGPTFTDLVEYVTRSQLARAIVCSRLRARGANVSEGY